MARDEVMQLYGRTDQVAVYFIGEVDAAYCVVTGSVPPSEATEALGLVDRLISERRLRRAILSLDASKVPHEGSPPIVAAWIAHLPSRGVRAWAVIQAKSAVAALATRPLLDAAAKAGLDHAAVPDLAAAKAWLATKK